MQALSSDNRDCEVRKDAFIYDVTSAILLQPEAAEVFERLDALDLKQRELAAALGIQENKISKTRSGERQFKAGEVLRAREWLSEMERKQALGIWAEEPDIPGASPNLTYVNIAVLPSYAGMGGGGTGEGDERVAKLPRHLIEDELAGRPEDFELIDVRGDSMEPDFHHGDQILIDRRDRNPRQPGPFALWDDDGYVVKLVERVPGRRGWYRIFSANDRYAAYEIEETETTIRGRPVWFARRL